MSGSVIHNPDSTEDSGHREQLQKLRFDAASSGGVSMPDDRRCSTPMSCTGRSDDVDDPDVAGHADRICPAIGLFRTIVGDADAVGVGLARGTVVTMGFRVIDLRDGRTAVRSAAPLIS